MVGPVNLAYQHSANEGLHLVLDFWQCQRRCQTGSSRLGLRVLFAKKDRDNIDNDELVAFRALAKGYAGMTDLQLAQLVSGKDFVEICHGDNAQVQK